MGKQRNMPQIKEQEKSPETELNEMEVIKLPHRQFKTMVIRMLNKLSENFNKETASIKKDTKLFF